MIQPLGRTGSCIFFRRVVVVGWIWIGQALLRSAGIRTIGPHFIPFDRHQVQNRNAPHGRQQHQGFRHGIAVDDKIHGIQLTRHVLPTCVRGHVQWTEVLRLKIGRKATVADIFHKPSLGRLFTVFVTATLGPIWTGFDWQKSKQERIEISLRKEINCTDITFFDTSQVSL